MYGKTIFVGSRYYLITAFLRTCIIYKKLVQRAAFDHIQFTVSSGDTPLGSAPFAYLLLELSPIRTIERVYHRRHITEIECLVVGFLSEKTVGRTADMPAVKAVALVVRIGNLHRFGKKRVDDKLILTSHTVTGNTCCRIKRECHP